MDFSRSCRISAAQIKPFDVHCISAVAEFAIQIPQLVRNSFALTSIELFGITFITKILISSAPRLLRLQVNQ